MHGIDINSITTTTTTTFHNPIFTSEHLLPQEKQYSFFRSIDEVLVLGVSCPRQSPSCQSIETRHVFFLVTLQHLRCPLGPVLNVTDEEGIKAALKTIGDKYGAPSIVVNNAGMPGRRGWRVWGALRRTAAVQLCPLPRSGIQSCILTCLFWPIVEAVGRNERSNSCRQQTPTAFFVDSNSAASSTPP